MLWLAKWGGKNPWRNGRVFDKYINIEHYMCAMVKSRVFLGDGHPTFNRNPYNGYINPYYWVDDHPLLYGMEIMGV